MVGSGLRLDADGDVPALHEDAVDDVDEAVGAVQVGADEAGGEVLPVHEGVVA